MLSNVDPNVKMILHVCYVKKKKAFSFQIPSGYVNKFIQS